MNGRNSVSNVAGIIGVSGHVVRMLSTRHISLTCIMTIYYELDRTATEGIPASYEDAWNNAQQGACHPAYGKGCHGHEVFPKAGFKN